MLLLFGERPDVTDYGLGALQAAAAAQASIPSVPSNPNPYP
jgi:hypothetical protein